MSRIYTTRAFAYNDGPTIPYTTQVGNIVIGNDNTIDYSLNYGGVKWWEGPDETYGYVIAVAVSDNSQPTPIGVSPSGASIQFKRSTDLTDASLITLINEVFNQSFTDISNALIWLDNNGHWTSYNNTPSTPTPTPSNTQLGTTPTPTPTNTQTPTNTVTPTPTNTQTPTNTVTPTPSNTQAGTTPTPTPTPTNASTGFMTISEVGSNVVISASGSINLNGLTLVSSNAGPLGGAGLGVSSATYFIGSNGYFDEYSGFTSNPTSFGSGGGGSASSSSGDIFGVIFQGAPPYMLTVPAGYISGTQISSTMTFNNSSFSSLGLTTGTYTYTWGSGNSLSVVIGVSTPTPTPTPSRGSAGSGSWYFYSDEGTINVGPPIANGNAIFLIQGSPIVETFNPNKNSGTSFLYFDVKDSVGTDYTTQFSGLTNGGTISITQNGDTARYTANSAGAFMVVNNGGGNYFFMLNAGVATQTQTSSNKFTYADPISITFGS